MVFIVTGCGYRNPNVYSGPSKIIYLNEWKNRTSQLGLDSQIYQSLTRWFQKTDAITTVRKKAGADLILAGEIISIDLPSLSYAKNSLTTQVKVKLKVRYILKDIPSNKIVFEMPGELWTEPYLVSTNVNITRKNEAIALETIIEDISKRIYRLTVLELPKL